MAESISEASKIRRALAQRIADACPDALFGEIAVTGSTALGLARDSSDLEINLWIDELPPVAGRVAWLESIGASQIDVKPEPRSDASEWIACVIDGIECEVTWQRKADLAATLTALLENPTLDMPGWKVAALLQNGISLRGDGVLGHWQARLHNGLSERHQQAVLDNTLQQWGYDWRWLEADVGHFVQQHYGRIYEVLFVLNRVWPPSKKWMPHRYTTLARTVPDLVARQSACERANAQQAAQRMIESLRDVFALFPEYEWLDAYKQRLIDDFYPHTS